MTKTKPCTLGPRHKWQWAKDVTNIKISITEKATRKHVSRRGVYNCECGATRVGAARSGL